MKISEFMQVTDYLRDIINGTEFEGHVFAVGGCVRDKNLGRDIKDIDLVVDLLNGGIVFAKHLQSRGYTEGTVVVYENYGTAMVRLKKFPGVELEFVQTRKECYHDMKSRNPDTCFGTIEDDCMRRDFTINALYYNISEGKEYDFNGNGLSDLKKEVIDTCGDPDIIFDEDPLRILRAVRFSSRLGYSISERTKRGMDKNKGRLEIISQERITDEFNKIMSGPNPDIGFELLYCHGLLQYVLPEMQALAYEFLPDITRRLHNIEVETRWRGMGQLYPILAYFAWLVGAYRFREVMIRMKYSNDDISTVLKCAAGYEKALETNVHRKERYLYELEYLCGDSEIYDIALVILLSEYGSCWEPMMPESKHRMFGYKLPVNGDDVMKILGIGPGPKIGEVLDDLMNDAFDNPDITREECMNLIKLRFTNK